MKKSVISEARKFATQKHGEIDQRRKYTNEPYIVHPAAVAKLVTDVGGSNVAIVAAWLHDTVEDTHTSVEEITQTFGGLVGLYVDFLSDPPKVAGMNRYARQAAQNKRLGNAPASVHTIKLADSIDNMKSIIKHDPEFWLAYREEKAILLTYLNRGHPLLQKMFRDILKTTKTDIQSRY